MFKFLDSAGNSHRRIKFGSFEEFDLKYEFEEIGPPRMHTLTS
jgi:hypothetical protein